MFAGKGLVRHECTAEQPHDGAADQAGVGVRPVNVGLVVVEFDQVGVACYIQQCDERVDDASTRPADSP